MATRRNTPRIIDPADAANASILAQREQRIRKQEAEKLAATPSPFDLGLDIPEREPETAAEFLADEFDKKNFGQPVPTFTRVVYGPDPLLTQCPAFKEAIERVGLEDFANATADAIRKKEHRAVPDALMQRALGGAIRRFGVEPVAIAFRDRILKIPSRTVEIESDREDELFGRPLEEAAAKYGQPGMAIKFLSELCIKVLGMRGYVVVKDENGDPVKVGTLIMGMIPQRTADRRREHFAEESRQAVRDAEENYADNVARHLSEAGAVGAGSRALSRDEVITASATESQDYLGQQRGAGLHFEKQV